MEMIVKTKFMVSLSMIIDFFSCFKGIQSILWWDYLQE